MKNIKHRTYGKLAPGEKGRWFLRTGVCSFGPQKRVVVGSADSFAVGRGVFYPTVVEPIESAKKHRVVFRLLPTYRGVEEEVRACLDCSGVQDMRWSKGLLSFWKFVTDDDSATPEKA